MDRRAFWTGFVSGLLASIVVGIIFFILDNAADDRRVEEARQQAAADIEARVPGYLVPLGEQSHSAAQEASFYLDDLQAFENRTDEEPIVEPSSNSLEAQARAVLGIVELGQSTQSEFAALLDGIITKLREALQAEDWRQVAVLVTAYAESFDERVELVRELLRDVCLFQQ